MSAAPRVAQTTLVYLWLLLGAAGALVAADPVWQHLSSKRGELPPPPGGSKQQTGAVVADLDGDGHLDSLNKPYTWETPRADVWLNNGTRASKKTTEDTEHTERRTHE